MDWCIQFAWCWLTAGSVSGVGLGLCFHRPDWLGGYGSWRRRLLRLGHIAFFGTGLLCLAMGLTTQQLGLNGNTVLWSQTLMITGAITMPIVCFLSAWKQPARFAFPVPVTSLLLGIGLFTFSLLGATS